MRGERERDTDALMARHGIGRRLATRVVALLGRQVDVTATVLAAATEDEALARLLLGPRLLRETESVTEELLRERARELGWDEADLLRLVEGEDTGWRTIALEDDLLAEDVRAEGEGAGPEELALVRRGETEISTRETEELFTPEEVARLKLQVLTSQDPDERVEALRKMVFAPMEGARKATIFAGVLTDQEASPRVRREAVRSLEQIGFRSDMAQAVRSLFTESAEDAVYAIQRLGALLSDAEEGEAALVLAVLLETLGQARETEVLQELLRLVGRSASMLVTSYQKTEQFVQSALRQLGRRFDELRPDVQEAFEACAEPAPDLMGDILWREVDRTEDARVRGMLLYLSETLGRTPARVEELAERTVSELLNPALPESEKAHLRYALVRLGEPAAQVVLERIAEAGHIERSELIRVLDVICTEAPVSEQTLEQAVLALLDLLKLADTVTRRTVVETAVLRNPEVPGDLQAELSEELLTLMSELNLPDTLDVIQNTLRRIGRRALAAAYDLMRRAYPSEPAERAASVVAGIVQDRPEDVPEVLAQQIHDLCMGLLGREDLEHGGFTVTLAAVCGYTEWGAGRLQEALNALREGLWKLPYSMDMVDALAVIAGSPNATPGQQEDLFALFERIVQFQARTGIGVRRETEEGTVYEFGREIQFDVRAVPAAVRGLERICVSQQADRQMRERIVKRLLILWEGVSNVRIVWGPAGVAALIRAMCAAACAPQATVRMKVRLGESLRRFLNKIRVVEALGDICSQPDPDPQMQTLAVETGGQMLDGWEQADVQDTERRLALLKAATRAAANTALDAEDERVEALRDCVVRALFSALREGLRGVREPLLTLRESPVIGPATKREIDERLTKAFGLVPVGRRRRG